MFQIRRVYGAILNRINRLKIAIARKRLKVNNVTIISQNCIGGVFYHDMGLPFRSPTINLFIPQPDFVRFVYNLEYYLNVELEMAWAEEYPVGKLDDVTIHFMHYESCKEAADAWNRRKQRLDLTRLLVVSSDRNGFDDSVFGEWKKIPYPKVLFTRNEAYAKEAGSVFFPKYADEKFVPDLIKKREFYKDNVLIDAVNQIGGERNDSAGTN